MQKNSKPQRNTAWWLALLIIVLAICFKPGPSAALTAAATYADTTVKPEKPYCVSLTLKQWVDRTNYIEYTKQAIKQTDMPSKTAVFIIDSLLAPLQREIADQVNRQMGVDSAGKKK
jgi:hypothetical protein